MEKIEVGKCLLSQILYEKRLSPTELSHATGISKTQLSEYMNNKRIMSLKNCKLIANALNVNMDDLYVWIILSE